MEMEEYPRGGGCEAAMILVLLNHVFQALGSRVG